MKFWHTLTASIIVLLCAVETSAQTTREEVLSDIDRAGGVYYAYPEPKGKQTAALKGYEPVYISHYGRHGSRYLIADQDYKTITDLMTEAHEAGVLTPLGEDVCKRLLVVWAEAEGHGGDLTPLGTRQHRGIAERMYANYPQVFRGSKTISARSSVVLRCAMSMVAFGDRLKELNPQLRITYEASQKYMSYINYNAEDSLNFGSWDNSPWAEEARKFQVAHTHGERLADKLFSNADFVRRRVNPHSAAWAFYWIAVDMQNMESDVSFYDLFTPDEIFDMWQWVNYCFYSTGANHTDAKGSRINNARPLLRNILDSAEEALANPDVAATLRFGHDGNVIPLLALMQIEDYGVSKNSPDSLYKYWSDFKAVPMAGNVQLVFFRHVKTGDVIVKILHNEQEVHIPVDTDIWPFYKWSDVESFYRKVIE